MYEDYQGKNPLDYRLLNVDGDYSYTTGPFVPALPGGGVYVAGGFPYLTPIWFTDWRDETLAWNLTCSLYAHLNPSPQVIIKGPDAKRFFSENFVNKIDDFPIGLIKHGIMCLDNGLIATHGVIMRTAEDTYEAYWHSPYIEYALATGGYDCTIEDVSEKRYMFQMQGPHCLEILEKVTGEDLHDIEYRHFRQSHIDGEPVRILRFGMAGVLGYEVHGDVAFAKQVYQKIVEVGNDYGIRRIGDVAYMMNHTLGANAQIGNNFLSAIGLDEGFNEFVKAQSAGNSGDYDYCDMNEIMKLTGSVGDELSAHFFNPYECGLGHCINYNHEFRGKQALLEYRDHGKRRMGTLEWNPDDLAEIYRSQFTDDPICPMDFPGGDQSILGYPMQCMDKILDENGEEIGISFGRTQSFFYHSMVSLASLDKEFLEEGTQVYVLWGDPGTRQFKIRAKVVPTPYGSQLRNADVDVNQLPPLAQ